MRPWETHESVDEGRASMNRPSTRVLVLLIGIAVVAAIGATTSRNASAVLPPLPNTVQQWNKIAEDTVVGSGAFQGEGEVYMSYTAAAVYDAVVAIQGGYEPYGAAITAPAGASVDCAVVEAAYRTLIYYFPTNASLDGFYSDAQGELNGCTADGGDGTAVGLAAAHNIIAHANGGWPPNPDRDHVALRDEGPRPRSVASHSAVCSGTNAMAWSGATIPAEEARTVSAWAADATFEPGVGAGLQRGKDVGSRNEFTANCGADRNRAVLYGECDPAVQHRRS